MMNLDTNELVLWITLGCVLYIILICIIWTLCAIAKKSDYISEKDWNEYCRKENERMQGKAQNAYDKYRERFANDYGKTIEEATECQAVKNYKEYLEEQYKDYGVVIREKVGD
jgi:phosphorylcholine metabolism protein LicD